MSFRRSLGILDSASALERLPPARNYEIKHLNDLKPSIASIGSLKFSRYVRE